MTTFSPREAAILLLLTDHAYITGTQDTGHITFEGWDNPERMATGKFTVPTDELHELRTKLLGMERESLQGNDEECETCEGDGQVEAWQVNNANEDGLNPNDYVSCPDCNGKGTVRT